MCKILPDEALRVHSVSVPPPLSVPQPPRPGDAEC